MFRDEMPWNKVGRWYHIRLISDGKKVNVEASDIPGAKFTGDFLEIDKNLSVIDYKIDFKRRNIKSDIEFKPAVIYKSVCTKVGLISASAFEKMDVYIFGRMEV